MYRGPFATRYSTPDRSFRGNLNFVKFICTGAWAEPPALRVPAIFTLPISDLAATRELAAPPHFRPFLLMVVVRFYVERRSP